MSIVRNILEVVTIIGIVAGGAFHVKDSIASSSTALRLEIKEDMKELRGELKDVEKRLTEKIEGTKLTQK